MDIDISTVKYIPTSPGFSTEGEFTQDEIYSTEDDALTEWKRRRQNWSGRFPGWGDGGESLERYDATAHAVLEGVFEEFEPGEYTLVELYDAWSAKDLIPADELFHYYDEPVMADDEDESGSDDE